MTLSPATRALALIVLALCVHRVECQVPAATESEAAGESAWREDWDSAMAEAQRRDCAILVLFEGGSPATNAWAGWDEPRVLDELRAHVINVRFKRYSSAPALSPSDLRMIRAISPDAESVIKQKMEERKRAEAVEAQAKRLRIAMGVSERGAAIIAMPDGRPFAEIDLERWNMFGVTREVGRLARAVVEFRAALMSGENAGGSVGGIAPETALAMVDERFQRLYRADTGVVVSKEQIDSEKHADLLNEYERSVKLAYRNIADLSESGRYGEVRDMLDSLIEEGQGLGASDETLYSLLWARSQTASRMDDADEALRFMERAVLVAPDSSRVMAKMALQAFQGEAMVSAWWDSDGRDSDDFDLAHNLKQSAEHVLGVRRLVSGEKLRPSVVEFLEACWERLIRRKGKWQSRLMVRWLQSMVASDKGDAERAILMVQEALTIGEGRMSDVQRSVLLSFKAEYEAQRE